MTSTDKKRSNSGEMIEAKKGCHTSIAESAIAPQPPQSPASILSDASEDETQTETTDKVESGEESVVQGCDDIFDYAVAVVELAVGVKCAKDLFKQSFSSEDTSILDRLHQQQPKMAPSDYQNLITAVIARAKASPLGKLIELDTVSPHINADYHRTIVECAMSQTLCTREISTVLAQKNFCQFAHLLCKKLVDNVG